MTLRALRAGTFAAMAFAGVSAGATTSQHTTVSANQAEVGEGISVELNVLTDEESPDNPRLRVPGGFVVQGPSVSSTQQLSFSNGHFEHRRGITATWNVVGTRPGRFIIGPASIQVGGKTLTGDSVNVEIVAAGSSSQQRRQTQNQNPFAPNFDPFSLLPKLPNFPNLPNLDNLDPNGLLGAPPDVPPEYQVDHALAPMAFLRATAAPTNVVVGEQVTFQGYAYGGRGPFDEVGSNEPSRADFLSQSLVDSSYRQRLYAMQIDGQTFMAVKIREVALFPLHSGTLTIGSMHMGFHGPGYPEAAPLQGLVRSTKEIRIVVSDPPIAGRPPGYELGDVGTYSLSAEVEPRKVEAGDAVAATIRLEGVGNVPDHVKHTEQPGVEWLEPTITDAVAPNGTVIGGSRTFHYVVRLDQPGVRDLGEATLPYYDARAHKYGVARARLGQVNVAPGRVAALPPSGSAGASPGAPKTPKDPFDGLGGVRKKLSPLPSERPRLTDRKWFWALLAGGPMSVVTLAGLTELARRLRRRFATEAASKVALARRALADAKSAATKRDASGVAGGVERALYATVEERFGLRARAVLRSELPRALERNGVETALAAEVVDLLDASEALRFSSGADSAPALLVERATSLVHRLSRAPRPRPRETAA